MRHCDVPQVQSSLQMRKSFFSLLSLAEYSCKYRHLVTRLVEVLSHALTFIGL